YKDSTAAPSPNSALINRVGQFYYQYAEPGTNCGPNKGPLKVTVGTHRRTRLRPIQGASQAMFCVTRSAHIDCDRGRFDRCYFGDHFIFLCYRFYLHLFCFLLSWRL
ncbi:hypothetical protein CROQUDRAFT_49463, partial [Cronartium quercuum f. sp. fusiforme G11]